MMSIHRIRCFIQRIQAFSLSKAFEEYSPHYRSYGERGTSLLTLGYSSNHSLESERSIVWYIVVYKRQVLMLIKV